MDISKYKYFKTNKGILILGDSFEIIKEFPNNYIDLIVTDPPYNIGDLSKLCKKGDTIISNKEMWGHFEPTNDEKWYNDLQNMFNHFHRINKGSIYLFYDRFEITKIKDMLKKSGFYPKNLLSIIKNNPLPHFRKNGFRSDFELCIFCQKEKGKDTFNFLSQEEMRSCDFYTIGQKDSEHPTEKPLKVISKYIRISSNEGDIVFDPFSGSGTTAVACEINNRRWIAIEKDENYFNESIERIKNSEVMI